MNHRLTSVQIDNFRSIAGSISVPLDASVILVFGGNGAGKTSLLSAIEFALTGEIAHLRDQDPNEYQNYLLNSGSEKASIVLSSEAQNLTRTAVRSVGASSGWHGDPLLDQDATSFFTERCYLPQATLGRLLELYQTVDGSKESPLSRFVKDILRLDYVDAVVDGLDFARDVRNLRRYLPELAEVEAQSAAASEELNTLNGQLRASRSESQVARAELVELLSHVLDAPNRIAEVVSSADLESELGQSKRRAEVTSLRLAHQEVKALVRQAAELDADDGFEAVKDRAETVAVFEQWQKTGGTTIAKAFASALQLLGGYEPSGALNFGGQLEEWLKSLQIERLRLQRAIQSNMSIAKTAQRTEQQLVTSKLELTRLDERIAGASADVNGFAISLLEIARQITGDVCPVCGRDFRELDTGVTLKAHVEHRATESLTRSRELAALMDDRNTVSATIHELQVVLESNPRPLSDVEILELENEHSTIATLEASLVALRPTAEEGDALRISLDDLERSMVSNRRAELFREQFDIRLVELEDEFDLKAVTTEQSFAERFTVVEASILERLAGLQEQERLVGEALDRSAEYRRIESEVRDAEIATRNTSKNLDRLKARLGNVSRLREQAKSIREILIRHRTEVSERTFSTSFNEVWADLFRRLAPSEPFVPSFRVTAQTGRPPKVELSTLDTAGRPFGSPGSMLSAGNLNTAALTLFLSLHLSVESDLPWLILDDPIQSMDDVHVAQFAALLRSLSKQHGRQIVVALHDRKLFEYLRLELSPAFDEDTLITVELAKSADGTTKAESNRFEWTGDFALAAVSTPGESAKLPRLPY